MNYKQEIADFRAGLKIEPPTITNIALRIGFFGGVGSGKSTTAAICALAITPPPGLIGFVDGEHGRSGLALDVACELAAKHYKGTKAEFEARFRVVHIEPPFNPLRVIAAGQMLLEAGAKTLILDIITQAWDSSGGYLDLKNDEVQRMVEANRNTSEQKVAQAAAAHIKPWTHTKLVHFVEEAQANVILCFQAKQKWDPKTNQVQPFETPIQESGITRTAICVGAVESRMIEGEPVGGFVKFSGVPGATKHTHPELLRLLPNGQQWAFEHGERLMKWLNQTSKPPKPADPLKALKRQLWEALAHVHKGDKGTGAVKAVEQYLWDEVLMGDTETLETLTGPRIEEILAKLKLQKQI